MNLETDYKPSGYAHYAATLVHAYCRQTFPDKPGEIGKFGAHMASTIFSGGFMDCFDHKGYSTHKYFDADAVTDHLGERRGAGVYGRVVFSDGSCIYVTCDGRLAYSDATGTAWAD